MLVTFEEYCCVVLFKSMQFLRITSHLLAETLYIFFNYDVKRANVYLHWQTLVPQTRSHA